MNLEIRQLTLHLKHHLEANADPLRAHRNWPRGRKNIVAREYRWFATGNGKDRLDGRLAENTEENYSLPVRLRKVGYALHNSLFPHLSVRRIYFMAATANPSMRHSLSTTLQVFCKSRRCWIVMFGSFPVAKTNASSSRALYFQRPVSCFLMSR